MPWSKPAARMREMVEGIRAIWQAWETGEQLNFKGDFYTHTRMIPAFSPGPNPFGPPRIFTAGFGPLSTRVAGEVSDGFLVHPVNSRLSLKKLTLPAIAEGAARAERVVDDIEIVCVTSIVTGREEEEFERSLAGVRSQLAFYATTPAYLPVFDLHGYEDLHHVLKQMARENRWDEMPGLIDDELVELLAVVGEPHEIPAKIRARLDGLSEHVSLVNSRAPDPRHFAEIVNGLSAAVA